MARRPSLTRAERNKQKHQFENLAALLDATPYEYRATLYEKLERERIAEAMTKSGKKRRGGWPFVSGCFEGSSKN